MMEKTFQKQDRTIRLQDGRRLGYLELGDPLALPVFLFHGSPGSRLDGLYIDPAEYASLHARVIVPDRPGLGRSDFQPDRTLRSWPHDVLELAGALGIERFAVMGVSGGGPFAAVCAHDIPEHLTAVAIVSGLAPLDAPGVTRGMGSSRYFFRLARWAPWLVAFLMAPMGKQLEANPDAVMPRVLGSFSAADRETMREHPQLQEAFVRSLREAYRQGVRGIVHDMNVCARPWGFRLQEIRLPVDIWQGEADTNVPPAMGRYQAVTIPNARGHFFPGEGHFMFAYHIREIFDALLQYDPSEI